MAEKAWFCVGGDTFLFTARCVKILLSLALPFLWGVFFCYDGRCSVLSNPHKTFQFLYYREPLVLKSYLHPKGISYGHHEPCLTAFFLLTLFTPKNSRTPCPLLPEINK